MKKLFVLILICLLLPYHVLAQETSDQEYINKLKYRRNRLDLVTKKRKIDEERSYSYTDIDTTTYSYEAYTHSATDISTQSMSRSEVKEVTDWFIYKGSIRELSDLEFLALVGEKAEYQRVEKLENQSANMRNIGNICIGSGLLIMLGGAMMSAGEAVVTTGAIGMTTGFFLNAFNLSPDHYIQPDYAQEKIDEYNINLKRQLGLPLDYN